MRQLGQKKREREREDWKEIIEFSQKEILLLVKKTVSPEQREQKANWNGLIREIVGSDEAKVMGVSLTSENESGEMEEKEGKQFMSNRSYK